MATRGWPIAKSAIEWATQCLSEPPAITTVMRVRASTCLIMSRMLKAKWKCALIGAGICGLVGPAIAVILLDLFCFRFIWPPSLRAVPRMIFEEWTVASVGFGPPALLLGAVGAVILQKLNRYGRPMKVAILQTAVLGLILGCAVPVIFEFVFDAIIRPHEYSSKNDLLLQFPIAAVTGTLCALLVFWQLHRTNLIEE